MIDFPSIDNILALVATTSNPLFTELYPYALYLAGFTIAGLVIAAVIGVIFTAFGIVVGSFRKKDKWEND